VREDAHPLGYSTVETCDELGHSMTSCTVTTTAPDPAEALIRGEDIVSDKTARPTAQTTSDAHAARIRDEVQERAYYRYVERGRTDGRAMEDWLAAESEIRPAAGRRSES